MLLYIGQLEECESSPIIPIGVNPSMLSGLNDIVAGDDFSEYCTRFSITLNSGDMESRKHTFIHICASLTEN